MHLASHAVLLPLAANAASASVGILQRQQQFDWEGIDPSRNLVYHDCYGEFFCARLELPLDYENETDSRTAVVAVTKLPAVVSDDDAAFGGSILVNPGGPGGSGVSYIREFGHDLQQFVDKPGRRHYEIVSWDPRGIGHTTPSSNCFRHDIPSRNAWRLENRGGEGLDKGLGAIKHGLSRVKAFSQRCKFSEHQWGDVMAYVNTPSVARDMLNMVDQIDRLREQKLAANEDKRDSPWPELRKRALDHVDKTPPPRLQYIGFSYGSALGNYFASLYPGRVGRMVLDGVVNVDDYATGPGWLTNLEDTDELLEQFWQGCRHAGPSICALTRRSDKSATDVKNRFWTWVTSLDDTPLPTLSPEGHIVVLTGNDVRNFVGVSLYSPIRSFQSLAGTLSQAMSGNTTGLIDGLTGASLIPDPSRMCSGQNETSSAFVAREAGSAVLCGDGDDITDKDARWWSEYLLGQQSKSRIFGTYWAGIRFSCSSWPFRPNLSFKGPFGTPEASARLRPGRPAAPLLFLSNRLDPVTPLRSARAMAAKHPGAGLVIQESLGHCVIGTAPSECTRRLVADYLESGDVPSGETRCETKCGPWDDGCSGYLHHKGDSDESLTQKGSQNNFFALAGEDAAW